MRSIAIVLLILFAVPFGVRAEAEAPRLKAFDVVDIALPDLALPDLALPNRGAARSRPAPTRLAVRAYGRDFELAVRDNDALTNSLPASARAALPPGDRFLVGELDGVPGSWVRLNRVDGKLSGAFFDGEHLYLLDRADGFRLPRRAPAGATLVYRMADLAVDTPIDAGGVAPGATSAHAGAFSDYATFGAHLREFTAIEGASLMALPVTIVTDTAFSAKHGGNTASVVVGRINLLDGIYGQQVGVGIQLLHHEILADDGPMTATDARDLLYQFRDWMRSGSGVPFGGLAHLLTDRDLDGGTVGIAFVGVLCRSSSGYSINQDWRNDTYSTLIIAHEMGHNFGAYHDNGDNCPDGTTRGIMNSSINGSDEFSQCSLDAMDPNVARASCLVPAESAEAVFDDGFEREAL